MPIAAKLIGGLKIKINLSSENGDCAFLFAVADFLVCFAVGLAICYDFHLPLDDERKHTDHTI